MNIRFESAVIFCQDLEKQREFYEKFLGQQVENDFGVCIGFQNGFTLWKLDAGFPVSKELGYTYEPIGNRNLELCFETEHFEDAVENILMSDLRILHNVVEEDWGQYTIRFYDPEGNLVEIGETLAAASRRMLDEGLSTSEVSQKMGLPQEMVEGFKN